MGSVKRCRPSPLLEYAHSATTRSSLSWFRPASVIRSPSKASSGSGDPLSVISSTLGAVRLMNVSEPPLPASKRATVVEENVLSPPVRSSSTWYDDTVTTVGPGSGLVLSEIVWHLLIPFVMRRPRLPSFHAVPGLFMSGHGIAEVAEAAPGAE